jgi:acetamidase/formamidase
MAIHHFRPTHYHTAIGSHEPVLRVGNGDTVITTTVDAMGKDASEVQVTPEGNPQTGPFYVADAEPGDTLVVSLDRIVPSRSIGYTGSVVAVNVVDPSYVGELPKRELAEWRVDNERGTATLIKPETKLGNLTIPLAPMLGCFGVAPPGGQAISTATSADHGGNMDYRGFVAGVTVYFPVFVQGALLHVGDGHATQGDGEIVGTGIEISMEVQFTVQVGFSIEFEARIWFAVPQRRYLRAMKTRPRAPGKINAPPRLTSQNISPAPFRLSPRRGQSFKSTDWKKKKRRNIELGSGFGRSLAASPSFSTGGVGESGSRSSPEIAS